MLLKTKNTPKGVHNLVGRSSFSMNTKVCHSLLSHGVVLRSFEYLNILFLEKRKPLKLNCNRAMRRMAEDCLNKHLLYHDRDEDIALC